MSFLGRRAKAKPEIRYSSDTLFSMYTHLQTLCPKEMRPLTTSVGNLVSANTKLG